MPLLKTYCFYLISRPLRCLNTTFKKGLRGDARITAFVSIMEKSNHGSVMISHEPSNKAMQRLGLNNSLLTISSHIMIRNFLVITRTFLVIIRRFLVITSRYNIESSRYNEKLSCNLEKLSSTITRSFLLFFFC